MKKFENYASNLRVLEKANQEVLDNTFIISGIINKFAIPFGLGWKVLKKLLSYEGSAASSIGSPGALLRKPTQYIPEFAKLEKALIKYYGATLDTL